jgi:hypothetical protein
VRVNYYVRELYGDPETFPDAWATPFGVLALNGPTSIFVHPLVMKAREREKEILKDIWMGEGERREGGWRGRNRERGREGVLEEGRG